MSYPIIPIPIRSHPELQCAPSLMGVKILIDDSTTVSAEKRPPRILQVITRGDDDTFFCCNIRWHGQHPPIIRLTLVLYPNYLEGMIYAKR